MAGLITNDETILRAARNIESQFGVQVLSPKAFAPEDAVGPNTVAYEVGQTDLHLQAARDSDDAEVRALLGRLRVSPSEMASGWLSRVSNSFVVRSGSKLVAYLTWPSLRHDGITMIRAAVDESIAGAIDAARGVVNHAMNLNVAGPTTMRLRTPANQVLLRDIARGVGFCSAEGTSDLTKLAFGRVATKSNWNGRRLELTNISGLKMEGQFPVYRRMEQQIPYVTSNGDHGHETLERLETLLSPVLFCLPQRPAVITPIRHEYSALLLGHSRQWSLLPAPTSSLFRERHFISGPNAFGQLRRGTLMFFYESNPPRGKGELVAIARVRRSYRKDSTTLEDADFGQSVLSAETVDEIGRAKIKTVTVFDNLIPLSSPVSLPRLQQIGCGQAHDLITTRAIRDSHVQTILEEAFPE